MENKKTFKVILILLFIYMLLSWIIASGDFSTGVYTKTGYNQFGLFDFILAPYNYLIILLLRWQKIKTDTMHYLHKYIYKN